MASGSDYTTLTSSAGNKARLEISWVENSTNINNNTSNLTITGRIKMTSGSYASDYVPYLRVYWHNNANNTNTLIGEAQISSLSSSWYTISDSINAVHYEDGTGRGYAYAEWTGSSFPYTPRSGSIATDTGDLTTIARASVPTATDGYIGSSITISTNKKSPNFTHTLSYSFGSLSEQIATGVVDSYGWTIPTSFYSQIPNASEGTCTITCTTYQGSTQIGTPKTTTFKAKCDPQECSPTFDYNVVLTDGTATTSLTGSSNILIANYSEAEIQWTATAKNGASISRVLLTNFDNTFTTSPIELYFSDTSSVFLNGFDLWCVDSREIATHLVKNYTIKQWFRPSVSLNVRRTTPTGSEVKATFTGSFFNESFGSVSNSLTLTWKYKLKSADSWTNGGTLVNGTHYNIVGNNVYSGSTQGTSTEITLSSSVFDYDKAYDIMIVSQDQIATTNFERTIAKGKPIYWWNENGLYWGQDDSKFLTATDMLDLIYPVGSIYLSVNNANPSTLFGGTWEQIKDKFILSAGDTYSGGSTGGNATINLNHNHGSGSLIASINFEGNGIRYYYDNSTQPAYNYTEKFSATEQGGSGTLYGGTRVVGSTDNKLSSSQSILPPYLAVYVWKRTR